MGARGPAPKPTRLKIMAGNPGHRPLNKDEPQPTLLETLPPAPKWFDKYAREFWQTNGPELVAKGLLTVVDVGAFESCCASYAEWRWAWAAVQKHGRTFTSSGGIPKCRPEVIMVRTAWAAFAKFCSMFGMNPADRSRVKTNGNSTTQSPLERLLAR